MKAQRLKIVESGWTTYSDYFAGIKFTDGLSDDPVSPAIASQIGSLIRVESMDDGEQVGEARKYEKSKKMKAPMVATTPENNESKSELKTTKSAGYTRESLEKIADLEGIQGLRNIADQMGVKGRSILELIHEILNKQG